MYIGGRIHERSVILPQRSSSITGRSPMDMIIGERLSSDMIVGERLPKGIGPGQSST